MGWSRTSGAAVLAAFGYASVAQAQGYFGSFAAEAAVASCAATSAAFQNLGCYASQSTNVQFTPNGAFAFAQAGSTDPSYAFPGFFSSVTYSSTVYANKVNNTVTPYTCAEVCRGHGYQFTYLIAGVCSCSMKGPTGTASTQPGTDCATQCGGDSTQQCGGTSAATVLVDPTFKSYAQFQTAVSSGLAQLAAQSQFLGCFKTPGFPDAGTSAAVNVAATSSAVCLQTCATLGFPLAYSIPASSGVTCNCGTEFGRGSSMISGNTCAVACDGSGNACNPTAATCCGASANSVPVYINPELTGCYTPTIPGIALTDPNSGSVTAYQCASVAASLTGGPKSLTTTSSATAYSPTAIPTHPVSVPSTTGPYVLYGCAAAAYPLTGAQAAQALTGDVSTCAQYCSDSGNYLYFSVGGTSTVGSYNCICGTGLTSGTDTNAAALVDMGSCNFKCNTQLCGGAASGPILIYARQSRATGTFSALQVQAAATPIPTYSCISASTSSSASSSSTSGSSSSSGTSSGSSTATSSGSSSSVTGSLSIDTSLSLSLSVPTSSLSISIPTGNISFTLPSASTSATETGTGVIPTDTASQPSSSESGTVPSGTDTGPTGSQTGGTEPVITGTPTDTEAGPSGTATSTSATISLAIPTPTSFSAIFDLPAGSAILVALTTCDSDGTCTLTVFVVQNMGCFITPQGVSPFSDGITIAGQNLNAGNCTADCAGDDYGLTSDISGTCYCGNTQRQLQTVDDSFCSTPCPDGSGQECGGGTAPLKRRTIKRAVGTYAQIFAVTNAAELGIIVPTVTLSTTVSATNTDTSLPSGTDTDTDVPTVSILPTTTDTSATTGTEVPTTGSGGISGSNTIAPTSSGPITAPSTSTTPIAVVLGILPPDTATIGLQKRQEAGSFIGGAGPIAPTDCTEATTFVLANGQLSSGGQLVSTDPGVPYIPLAVSGTVGSITTEFVSINGELFWNNAAFADGTAGFCQDASGRVYATFEGAAAAPAGCTEVTVVAYPAYQCVGGVINPSATPPVSTGALGNGTLTLAFPYYFPEASPAGQSCVTVVEEWVVGETSLLPEATVA